MAANTKDVIVKRKTAANSVNSSNGSAKNMSRADKADNKDKPKGLDNNKKKKVFAVLLALLAVVMFLAFVSYTSSDEANARITVKEIFGIFTSETNSVAKAESVHNWLGIFGAIISDFAYNSTIGYVIIFLPIFLLLWAKELFTRLLISDKLLRRTIVYIILGLLVSTITGTMQKIDWLPEMTKEWSGSMGLFMANTLTNLIGISGALLLLFTSIIITLIVGTSLNVEHGFRKIWNGLAYAFSSILMVLKSSINKFKLKSRKPGVIDNEEAEESESVEDNSVRPVFNPIQTNEPDEPVRIIRSNLQFGYPNQDKQHNQSSQGYVTNSLQIKLNPTDKNIAATTGINNISNFEKEKNYLINVPPPVLDNISRISQETPNNEPIRTQGFIDGNYELEPVSGIEDEYFDETTDYPENDNAEALLQDDFDNGEFIDDFESTVDKPLIVTVNDKVRDNQEFYSPISTKYYDEEIDYQFPPATILASEDEKINVDDSELKENARILQEKLETFKIYIENLSVTPGPVVTQYEFVPSAGIKISKIAALSDDIAMALKARGIRIIAPIPGKGTVGIEIPNQKPSVVRFCSLLNSSEFQNNTNRLPLALGKTISGDVFIADLTKMPHLLIAGSTGSGKSVGINTILASLLYRMHPRDLKLVIIDPKKVELQQYSRLKSHFLATSPDIDDFIVTNPKDAVIILKALVLEMMQRYDILSAVGQRNIIEYNRKVIEGKLKYNTDMCHRPMPNIVVIVDELADLMMTASKEVEEPIVRLAQMARGVGIHLVIATQRPSVDVITGLIKANFPARIAYLVAQKVDSRTIIDGSGAEQLLGNGDMLFMPNGQRPIRIQNSLITTEEVEDLCDFIGRQEGYSEPYYLPSLNEKKNGSSGGSDNYDRDPLFEEAARLIIRHQQGSVSLIQRRLKVGYARAGRIVDELESAGIIGPYDGSKARQVLFESEADLEAVL